MNARTSFEQERAENRTSSREEPRQLLYDHSERTLETTMLRRAQESILSDLNTMPVRVDSTVRFLNKYDLAACRDKKKTLMKVTILNCGWKFLDFHLPNPACPNQIEEDFF